LTIYIRRAASTSQAFSSEPIVRQIEALREGSTNLRMG
jgi:hypothetical protein